MKVHEIVDWLDGIAPFDTQLEFDNSGLLVGNPEDEVRTVLFALDVTPAVLDEAERLGANLLITHHPLMFSARKRITETDYEGKLLCRMIRMRLNHLAAHTNLDRAPDGINDVLAARCGLKEIQGEGFLRTGLLPEPMTAAALSDYLSRALGSAVRLMGNGGILCTRLGMCSGSGGDEWQGAAAMGADAFLTGEMKHHFALEAAAAGIPVFECGHWATEAPGIFALADTLQKYANLVKWDLRIFTSEVPAYGTSRST